MISDFSTYIGIDPTSGQKDFAYAVLDRDLNLVDLADANLDEMLAFLDEQESAVVAVNAPSQTNRGLVKEKLDKVGPARGHFLRGADIRMAEYELREHGIVITGTPSREDACPAWMRSGFNLYRELSGMGYEAHPADSAARLWLETHPYACFCVLLEQIPFPKPNLEGRLQRQLILHEKRLRINDPMGFFEELTRFKLVKGILPLEEIYSPTQLDTLVSAYTAWLAANRPEEVSILGERSEGHLVLPTKELKKQY